MFFPRSHKFGIPWPLAMRRFLQIMQIGRVCAQEEEKFTLCGWKLISLKRG